MAEWMNEWTVKSIYILHSILSCVDTRQVTVVVHIEPLHILSGQSWLGTDTYLSDPVVVRNLLTPSHQITPIKTPTDFTNEHPGTNAEHVDTVEEEPPWRILAPLQQLLIT